MTKLEQAARQALEALEQWNAPSYKRHSVINALREALAEPTVKESLMVDPTDEEAHKILGEMSEHMEQFGNESTTNLQLSGECIRFIAAKLFKKNGD